MSSFTLALIAVLWPPLVVWVTLKFFPNALTRFVEKEIDRRSDTKLERIKAELQGKYSTLKTSVDVLSTTNSGMHPHIIDAVSALWANMLSMREKFGTMLAFDTIVLPEEAQAAFGGAKHANLLEYVRPFAGDLHTNPLMVEFNGNDLDRHRLFTGDRLWLIFYIFRAFLLRNGLLISQSFGTRTYVDWRKDGGIAQLLGSVLSADEVTKYRQMDAGGLSAAASRMEAEFLHEATRVMSGSKAMSDNLSDMHAIMLLQNAAIGKGS